VKRPAAEGKKSVGAYTEPSASICMTLAMAGACFACVYRVLCVISLVCGDRERVRVRGDT
jgi:hypothetical protein